MEKLGWNTNLLINDNYRYRQEKSFMRNLTNEELLNYLILFYKENGRVPRQKDFKKNPNYPSYSVYLKRFGKWNNALNLCGLNNNVKHYTDKELIEFLIKFYSESGKIPTQDDFKGNPKYPRYTNYHIRFGSWTSSLKMAGFNVTEYHTCTDNELLEFIREFHKENNKTPVIGDFSCNPKYPNYCTYFNRFGSWNNALKLAGLSVNMESHTSEELLEYIKNFYKENNKAPSINDFINNPKYPSYMTYENRFGSWIDALKIIGLDMDSQIKRGSVDIDSNECLKGRLWEIQIIESFKNEKAIDCSGENYHSPIDGICPNGYTYDAKSSALHNDGWHYNFRDKDIKNSDYFYLGAFDKNFMSLIHKWLIPKEIIGSKKGIVIKNGNTGDYNIENMKKYEVFEQN